MISQKAEGFLRLEVNMQTQSNSTPFAGTGSSMVVADQPVSSLKPTEPTHLSSSGLIRNSSEHESGEIMVNRPGEDEISDEASVRLHDRPEQPSLLKNLNRTHAAFYAEQGEKLEKQLNETTLKIALDQRQSEADRGIPFANWSFEGGIDDAARSAVVVRSEQGRKAGMSRKTDTLQELIQMIVRASPKIKVTRLVNSLKELDGKGTIEGVETLEKPKPQIYFKNRNGHGEKAPISGLKHRLTRARQVIGNEVAQTG
jgi:hypothetical protein